MSLDFVFDYLGVRLNGEKAAGKTLVINWVFSDLGRRYMTTLSNSALTYLADRASDRADATVTLERDGAEPARSCTRCRSPTRSSGVSSASKAIVARVTELFSLLDDFSPTFPIVEPNRVP